MDDSVVEPFLRLFSKSVVLFVLPVVVINETPMLFRLILSFVSEDCWFRHCFNCTCFWIFDCNFCVVITEGLDEVEELVAATETELNKMWVHKIIFIFHIQNNTD